LRAAPDVRVLATSREALEIEGECVWSVPPLSVPGDDDLTANTLAPSTHNEPLLRPRADAPRNPSPEPVVTVNVRGRNLGPGHSNRQRY